ncbi:MAG: hypothetical protein JRJ80_19540 [Deltaproteobacteria bacterium]|jgi:hypothetical protein|nr:hypothetical protein [Deltaproteobacteria bacterium]
MKNFALGLSLLVGLGSMVGCGDSGSSGGSGCPDGEIACDGMCIPSITATLGGAQGIQASVFDTSCALSDCHGATGIHQAELELSSVDVSLDNLVDQLSMQIPASGDMPIPRVDPQNSSGSYIMNKLLAVDMATGTFQMPITGTLCDAKVEAVRQWIDDGAPVN